MNEIIHPAASALVINKGHILLIQRGKEPSKGLWSLPGGSKEPNESFEECAIRELNEETGLHARELKSIGNRERNSINDQGIITRRYLIETFAVLKFSGEAIAASDAADIGWFNRQQVTLLPTTIGLLEFLDEHTDADFRL